MKIAILGSGIVGAAIAYELSLIEGLHITLLDQNTPASGSTGAALGVLMGVISHKTKGRAWKLRQASMQRYETLIPELETITQQKIPYNRQGILMLRFEGDDQETWQRLLKIRQKQGWHLEIWEQSQLQKQCPYINNPQIIGAIYSPQDRQVHPTILTQSLIIGASLNGVNCQFGIKIQKLLTTNLQSANISHCSHIQTSNGSFDIDWLIIAAGLGSTPLTKALEQPLDIRPVLGQAIHLKSKDTLDTAQFQPVITGNDVHIVPLENNEYWVGATVEFPNELGEVTATTELLTKVYQEAISYCPHLADATIIRTWSGKRPRPEGQSAPIISQLPHYDNVFVATGHYRNGVLLAPATALAIRDMIIQRKQ